MLAPAVAVQAHAPQVPGLKSSSVTAYDLIAAMNSLRVSYGHSPLVEDAIIDSVAQATASTMAANELSWHIGNVRGRVAAAGYGGGGTVWATENFAMGYNLTMSDILGYWSDAAHMLPATQGAYCNVGAGIATAANGMVYYVLQAAYVSGKACGSYTAGSGSSGSSGSSTAIVVPQIIYPVEVATPDAEGRTYHVVRDGQSLWAIAIAYHVTIKDLETWNNLTSDSIQIGEKLFIPNSNTEGYATPTPVGMVQVSTPDATGKVVHVVAPYQSLSTIAQAYGVSVSNILALNGIQQSAVLQIGQKLIIKPGIPTPTPTITPFNPFAVLTPVSEGQFYYVVRSGENLSYIARLFGVKLADLMTWNGLNDTSVLQVGEKLVMKLEITPTSTPLPDTQTPTPSATPSTPTPTHTQSPQVTLEASPTRVPDSTGSTGSSLTIWIIAIGLTVGGVSLATWYYRSKKKIFKGKEDL